MGPVRRSGRPGSRCSPPHRSIWKLLVGVSSYWNCVIRESRILSKNHVGKVIRKLENQMIPWYYFLSVSSNTTVLKKRRITSCSEMEHQTSNVGQLCGDSHTVSGSWKSQFLQPSFFPAPCNEKLHSCVKTMWFKKFEISCNLSLHSSSNATRFLFSDSDSGCSTWSRREKASIYFLRNIKQLWGGPEQRHLLLVSNVSGQI